MAGAGYIGLELGIAYRKLGVDFCIVEARDRILPGYDVELVKPVAASMRRLHIDVRTGCSVESIEPADGAAEQSVTRDSAGHEFSGDRIVVAVRDAGGRLERLQMLLRGPSPAPVESVAGDRLIEARYTDGSSYSLRADGLLQFHADAEYGS